MTEERITTEYMNTIYDLNGNPINVKIAHYFQVKINNNPLNILYS
ncbi:MAG: hypothetical protein ACTSRA_22410 [Promethearchaeota archaeon]